MIHRAATPEEMFELGRNAAASAKPGDVIILTGDLGAGKTHWTKGFVHGMGSTADVTSPTFSLIHEYSDGRVPVFHFDFYRLESADELIAMGWDEYLENEGVVIAEWGNRFLEIFPAHAIQYAITLEADGNRSVCQIDQ